MFRYRNLQILLIEHQLKKPSLTLIPAAYKFITSERLRGQKKPCYGYRSDPHSPLPPPNRLLNKTRLLFKNMMISPRKCRFLANGKI